MRDPEARKMVHKLIEEAGGKEECLRLGLLGIDDNETLYTTTSGLGFLLGVIVPDIDTRAAAYATGWRDGCAQGLK